MLRRIGRVTIDERPDALIVTAPFLTPKWAVVYGLAVIVIFAVLFGFSLDGTGRGPDPAGIIVLFCFCGYFTLLMTLDRSIATIRSDRIVVRHGPVPMWPATTIRAVLVEDVRAVVYTGITKYGGRIEYDSVNASLVGGNHVTLVDQTGDFKDAEQVAALVMEWLWSHR